MAAQDPSARGEFQEVLASLAAIDRLKSREEVLAHEANLASRKTDVAQRAREVYAKQGVVVSDELITKGVDAYFDQRLRWTPPELGAAGWFARGWINRARLAKVTFMAVGALIVAGLAIDFGVIRPLQAYRFKEHHRIQTEWVNAAQKVDRTDAIISTLLKGADHEVELSNQGPPELASAASRAKELVAKIADSVRDYTSDVAKDEVPKGITAGADGLYSDAVLEGAEAKVRTLLTKDSTLNQFVGNISQIVAHLHDLRLETEALEQSWTTLIAAHPPEALASQVSSYHRQALATVRDFGARDKVEAQRVRIVQALEDFRSLQDFPSQIHAAADRARKLAVDPNALTQIAQKETAALAAVDGGLLNSAKQSLVQLEAIEKQLDETFEVRIVNRPNEYTRIWYNNAAHTDKMYYIVVEAVGSDNTIIPQAIASEQDQSTKTVRCWAERVDFATYESVGNDKKDDGVVENNLFAKKQRGYLAPTYLMGGKVNGGELAQGRLNYWPHR